MSSRIKMMVTSALPYGNGPLHLGHMVEHIMTDIWVRTQRLSGHECLSFCGDDAHGTPIMLKAQQIGITPEELTREMQQSHEKDLEAFAIHYDMYHTTHSSENEALVAMIYQKLQENQDILTESISQAYDAQAQMFLPDRYIKGTCPRCHTADQYGDNCEQCGATYCTTELIDAVSTVTATKPEYRQTLHYFFNLPKYQDFLQDWTQNGHIPKEMSHKLQEWFDAGLKPWDISRDAPYFGFQIPGTENKYFYVWLDAPVGYMATCQKYCREQGLNFDDFWKNDSSIELYHVVGKDIMYFHALFWPALLKSANLRRPNAIFTHGFLTINGQKMSKSRGTFIQAQTFSRHFPTDTLRYYFAAKMNGSLEDLDLVGDDYIQRVNADLIGKVINIASRSASFIHKLFAGKLSDTLENAHLFDQWLAERHDIILAYQQRDFAKAIRQIMGLADKINQYVDQQKPWILAKNSDDTKQVQRVCSMALNGFRLLMHLLAPVLPQMVEKVKDFFNETNWTWQNIQPVLGSHIQPYEPLLMRLQLEQWQSMLEDTKERL